MNRKVLLTMILWVMAALMPAMAQSSLTVYAGEAQEIKFEKKFDYIICFEALEYSSDPAAFLNFLKSLLSKGGVLLIEAENQYGIQYLAGKKESHSGIPFSWDF